MEQAAERGSQAHYSVAGMTFASGREAVSAALLKLGAFLGWAARRSALLWNALNELIVRYWDRLARIASKLGASGFSVSVGIPPSYSFALNFDLPHA